MVICDRTQLHVLCRDNRDRKHLRERIKKVQKGNEKVVKAVEELKRVEMKSLRDKK